jgi:hypothetical protein
MSSNILKTLTIALVGVGLVASAPAEARFATRTDPEEPKKTQKAQKKKPAAKKASPAPHAASAVGTPAPVPRQQASSYTEVRSHRVYGPSVGVGYYVAPAPVVVHERRVVQHRVEQRAQRRDPFELRHLELGVTAQPLLDGGVLGLNLLVDWTHTGIDLRFDNLVLAALDGSGRYDAIRLFDATATFGLLIGDRGRLRAHAGLYSALTPDAAFLGPGGGLSASLRFLGPLTAEAAGHLVVFPFTKLDTRAALGLRLGPLEGRLGWRFTVLDDQGRVDGVRNTELIAGPYLGALIVI